jgi:rSAM-associated Gly-rich repeat protein
MAFLSRSRLFGVLLIAASLPMDPGMALATGTGAAPPPLDHVPRAGSVEARLRRIAEAMREREQQAEEAGMDGLPEEFRLAAFLNAPRGGWANAGRVGWGNGGFRNGGFRNGGFYNGGFRNGGFYNGGFRNGGGWLNSW